MPHRRAARGSKYHSRHATYCHSDCMSAPRRPERRYGNAQRDSAPIRAGTTPPRRCAWAGSDARMIAYHDTEWGTAVHDDRVLFEFLTLEGAQAALSWQTI